MLARSHPFAVPSRLLSRPLSRFFGVAVTAGAVGLATQLPASFRVLSAPFSVEGGPPFPVGLAPQFPLFATPIRKPSLAPLPLFLGGVVVSLTPSSMVTARTVATAPAARVGNAGEGSAAFGAGDLPCVGLCPSVRIGANVFSRGNFRQVRGVGARPVGAGVMHLVRPRPKGSDEHFVRQPMGPDRSFSVPNPTIAGPWTGVRPNPAPRHLAAVQVQYPLVENMSLKSHTLGRIRYTKDTLRAA